MDMSELTREEVTARIEAVQARIDARAQFTDSKIDALGNEMKAEMRALAHATDSKIAALDHKIDVRVAKSFTEMIKWMVGTAIAMMALAVTLIIFLFNYVAPRQLPGGIPAPAISVPAPAR